MSFFGSVADWFGDMFDAVSIGVRMAICWMLELLTDLVVGIVYWLLTLIPAELVGSVPWSALGRFLGSAESVFPVNACAGILAALFTWKLSFLAIRTIKNSIPTLG